MLREPAVGKTSLDHGKAHLQNATRVIAVHFFSGLESGSSVSRPMMFERWDCDANETQETGGCARFWGLLGNSNNNELDTQSQVYPHPTCQPFEVITDMAWSGQSMVRVSLLQGLKIHAESRIIEEGQ